MRTGRAVAAGLVALVLLVGPAALPAGATGDPGAAPVVLAQSDGGFGDDGTVRDEYGNSVWDYQVSGLNPRGPQDMDQAWRNLPLGLSGIGFSIVQFLVVAVAWMLSFALRFGLADLLLAPVTEIVDLYQSYVDQLGLVPVALMFCVFWFGLLALRGRVGRGVGEIVLSFVLVVVIGAVLAAPGRILLGDEGLLGRARDLGSTVAMLAVQDPAVAWQRADCARPPGEELLPDGCRLEDFEDRVPNVDDPEVLGEMVEVWLVDLFVRQPHQYIVYGERIDCPVAVNVRRWSQPGDTGDQGCQPRSCVERYNTILTMTPAAADDHPGKRATADRYSYMYDMMHPEDGGYEFDDGCRDDEAVALAEYNKGGSWDRVALTLFTLATLVLLLLFVLFGVLVPIIAGQILVAILIVALVFVLPVALLGGASRHVLWKWVGLLFGAVFMIVVALFGLSLMLITTDLLLQSTWHLSISMLLASFSSLVFLIIQRRLLRGSIAGGSSLGGALGRVAVFGGGAGRPAGYAGDAGWARPVDAGAHGAVRTATFAGAREDWAARRQIRRRMRNEDAVRDAFPELVQRDAFRVKEAQNMYTDDSPVVRAWRRRRRGWL